MAIEPRVQQDTIMLNVAKDFFSNIFGRLGGFYQDSLVTSVQFKEFRQYTQNSLSTFEVSLKGFRQELTSHEKELHERLLVAEKERVMREAELLSKINALEARLSALSEQALHAVAKESAIEVFEKLVAERKQQTTRSLPAKAKKAPDLSR